MDFFFEAENIALFIPGKSLERVVFCHKMNVVHLFAIIYIWPQQLLPCEKYYRLLPFFYPYAVLHKTFICLLALILKRAAKVFMFIALILQPERQNGLVTLIVLTALLFLQYPLIQNIFMLLMKLAERTLAW